MQTGKQQAAATLTPSRSEKINPWLILFIVSLGLFMAVIDMTILNIALPTIADDLNATMASIQWTFIAYTLAMTGLVPFFGRISDVIGRKRLFVTGLLVFTLGSLLAGLSTNVGWLIAARVIQAFGGALITTNALAIIADIFPPGRRGIAMGVQTIIVSGGGAIGPSLGGVLVTQFGWEAVFLVNLPIGLSAAAVAAFVLPPLQTHRTLEPIDWLGAFLMLFGLLPVMLAFTKGASWGWGSPLVLSLFAGGLIFLILFVLWENRVRYPLIDLSLFRIRAFTAGQIAGASATICMSSMNFILPFYWQSLRGLPAQEAGLLMLPIPFGIMFLAPVAGRLSDRHGARIIATAGLAGIMSALFFLSRVTVDMPVGDVIWRVALLGAGLGTFLAPNNNAVMSVAPPSKRGIASGLLGTFRFTGQSLGVAISGAVFGAVLSSSGALTGGEMPTPEFLEQLLQNPAALDVFQTSFIAALRMVSYTAMPFALVGIVLSFSRGQGDLLQRTPKNKAG